MTASGSARPDVSTRIRSLLPAFANRRTALPSCVSSAQHMQPPSTVSIGTSGLPRMRASTLIAPKSFITIAGRRPLTGAS